MEEDKDLEDKDLLVFAETNFRNIKEKFGIRVDDRRRHVYLIGKTGTGKSTAMENMIYQDIQAGRGLAIVDPHGDLAEKALNFIPSHRVNDVIYFNPADVEYPIAFNILENIGVTHRHLIASGLVGVFKKIWADSWGPRLEYVLRNAILALLEYPGSTLLGVMRLLVDKEFRNKVIARLTDPVVKSFWVDEYSKYPDRFQSEAIAPIQNKVGQFLSTALIRNIVGQVQSRIDMRDIMDSGKILIMNMSKGRIGEDASALLGAMMITKLQLAAMSRVDVPEPERKDFFLYVDEFQNFATESFANILSEARKYRLNLTLAHQYVAQLDEKVASAVFGNVGTIIGFRIGAEDAEFLAKEFAPKFDETDLVNLSNYDIYLKLMINGVTSEPFSATTLPPLFKLEGNRDKIIRVSRERYAEPQAMVEEKIIRWASGSSEDVGPEGSDSATNKTTFEAKCNNCGTTVFVPFMPDGVRPIYCKDCFKKIREQKPTNKPIAIKEK
ncbi:MAG: CxxC-x17-CxxC domain-containing protein [Patescibacteria group bacterium]